MGIQLLWNCWGDNSLYPFIARIVFIRSVAIFFDIFSS